jgi:hypothetical protein
MTIKLMAKFCSVAAIILLVLAALGPANWAPRTEYGWQIDHFVGYFVITSIVCFAWPRPFVVGPALMAVAALLEGLQTFTQDRCCGAKTRSGKPCMSPAVNGKMRCRMHGGAAGSGAPRGN